MNAYIPTNRITLKKTQRRELGQERIFHYSHLPTHISFAPTFQPKPKLNSEEEEEEEQQQQQQQQHTQSKSQYQCPPLSSLQTSISSFRHKCGKLVNSRRVQAIIIILIILNAITLGIGTTHLVLHNKNLFEFFEIVDKFFLIVFTSELVLQFVHHGWQLFFDGWLVFDFSIIVVSWSCQSLQVLRGLRAIRALRVCRSLRLISRIRVMREIVKALLVVIPQMISITILNSIVMYVFGVMFTMLFRDLYKRRYLSHDYFGSLEQTVFTLFQLMTLDGWSDICREVMRAYRWAWIPFFAYVGLSAFIMINLVVAVVCDAIADLERAKTHERVMSGSCHSTWSGVSILSASDAGTGSFMDNRSQLSTGHELKEKINRIEQEVAVLARSQERTQDMADFLVKQIQSSRRRRRGGMNFLESDVAHPLFDYS